MIKVFSHWFHWKTVLQIAFDLLVPVVCVAMAVLWIGQEHGGSLDTAVLFAMIFAMMMITLNALLGFYRRVHSRTVAQSQARAILSLCLAVPLAYLVFKGLASRDVNRELMLLSGLTALFGTLAYRLYAAHNTGAAVLTHRVLIFGAGAEADTVGAVLKKSDPDIQIMGFYPSPTDTETVVPGASLLSRERLLFDTASALKVNEIIVAVKERRGGVLPLRELLDCKLSGVRVLDLASYFERALGQIRLDSLRAGWLIFGDGFRQGRVRTVVKRVFDLVASSILLILALPVMLLTAILIAFEDGGKILYKQERVGLNGRLFNVIKFRSMRHDAERDGTPRWATQNDARVTRVGRVIRKLRIDELPQLYSVLVGEMSLVGPRPERPYFVDQLTREIPFYAVRHSVKPGVTGWAQVNYHYGASIDDSLQKLQYDLYYVKNHTLFLDMVVLFETVGVVLTGKGAN
ncbi:TIGR03013 family XrtA/PEP-CTERM system glycosyltransferase [Chitinimonas sp. BJB300]|uniref:TIGR03013 family XrtA/PEP-CTERM system glycosyltransferase n=1 Tax=Chitinimonas sp. BJB300 TaxID=1559339 RepID=UPI000C0D97B1|nr:TIGR03013 family XrtA/PEP-CTERM system glycosyltransferase [Chitinimonas sp. BJB300]PHV13358.1 sugar transferase [Chitinimonas sp. BJB300]TSJ85273.1 TIGR03013 family PEP-CTERM/XrtA system glycosyltransferase [Chitinimonas sp. BJB300]